MGSETIYNLFKFIEDKKPQYKLPFKVKFIYDPNSLTKEDLDVKGNLNLNNISIQSLPDGLKVEGSLSLADTPIQSLPNDLKVGRSLWLTNTPIQSLPNNLKVGDYLGD